MERDEPIRGQLLAEVETLAPILAEHALQSERLGRLADPTVEALRKTRLLRFICPRELGGDEADPLTQLEVLEALARIDSSAGLISLTLRLKSYASFGNVTVR
jgi:alkylation response protein AidB-like acyl-CoA dehydrogenase